MHLKLQHLIPKLVTLDHKVKDLLVCLVVIVHLLQLLLMDLQQFLCVIFWKKISSLNILKIHKHYHKSIEINSLGKCFNFIWAVSAQPLNETVYCRL